MIAAVPQWLTDMAAISGAILAVATVLTLGYRTKPAKWLMKSIRDDMAEGRMQEIVAVLDQRMPKYLTPILYELRNNDGGSMKDHFTRRFDRQDERQDEAAADRRKIREELAVEIARVKAVEIVLARDLSESHDRADAIPDDVPGAAADAASRSGEPTTEEP